MSDIKEGDQVSWKYGGGNPEGTVAEIKTSGELAIETKGKQVKVNASEENPAVHVARDGNDVVKRESALTKQADTTEEGDSKATKEERPSEDGTKHNGQDPHKDAETNKQEQTPPVEDSNATACAAEESEDKMDITPREKKVEVGEKRSREDDDSGETQSEEEQAEKENGKESKKTKLDNGEAEENGHAAKNGHDHNENALTDIHNGNGVEASATAEEGTPKKSKGPGRPKKADAEAKHAEGNDSTIARRTRSKA